MGNVQVWKNKCELVEGYYFYDGDIYQIYKIELPVNPLPLTQREYKPEDQKDVSRGVPSQKFVNSRMDTYFTANDKGDYILKIYIRTVTKNGRTMNFFATNSRNNERIDVHFDDRGISFDPFEMPEYTILINRARIDNKNGYVDMLIQDAQLV